MFVCRVLILYMFSFFWSLSSRFSRAIFCECIWMACRLNATGCVAFMRLYLFTEFEFIGTTNGGYAAVAAAAAATDARVIRLYTTIEYMWKWMQRSENDKNRHRMWKRSTSNIRLEIGYKLCATNAYVKRLKSLRNQKYIRRGRHPQTHTFKKNLEPKPNPNSILHASEMGIIWEKTETYQSKSKSFVVIF